MGEEEEEKKNQTMTEEKKPSSGEEKKQGEEPKVDTPLPPPQEIVLKVFMHCEGCAKKVKRSLKGFPGVEDVITDSRSHKVVVKGEMAAADPVKVMERIQRKSNRKVELISPLPVDKAEKQETEKPKAAEPEKKEEVVVEF